MNKSFSILCLVSLSIWILLVSIGNNISPIFTSIREKTIIITDIRIDPKSNDYFGLDVKYPSNQLNQLNECNLLTSNNNYFVLNPVIFFNESDYLDIEMISLTNISSDLSKCYFTISLPNMEFNVGYGTINSGSIIVTQYLLNNVAITYVPSITCTHQGNLTDNTIIRLHAFQDTIIYQLPAKWLNIIQLGISILLVTSLLIYLIGSIIIDFVVGIYFFTLG